MIFANTKERIMQYLSYKGISRKDFFNNTGIKRGFLDMDKLNGAVSDENLAKIIAAYPDLSITWLLTEEGQMTNANNINDVINHCLLDRTKEHELENDWILLDNGDIEYVPKNYIISKDTIVNETDLLLDMSEKGWDMNQFFDIYIKALKAAKKEYTTIKLTYDASIPAYMSDYSIPFYQQLPVSAGRYDMVGVSESPTGFIQLPEVKAIAAFPVIGCSMEPLIKAGDIIAVDRVDRWDRLDPDKIYMVITKHERMIKHLRVDNENDQYIWAISSNYKEFKVFKEEIVIIYQVVYFGRLV